MAKSRNYELSEDQSLARNVIENSKITALTGRAGSGKTHLAGLYAYDKLISDKSIKKCIITRPTVARKVDYIGFLPGEIEDKFDPWIKPIKDIFYSIENPGIIDAHIKNKNIEIVPLMYIQGTTFTNSVVIIDEAQNLSKEAMISVFTRLGGNSKMIFCGDPKQCLLPHKEESGYPRLVECAELIEELGTYELTTNFRSGIVEQLLEKF